MARWHVRRPITRRLIGGVAVATGVFVVVSQIRSMVDANTGLPNIRHSIYWTHDLYEQTRFNPQEVVSTDLASLYLLERILGGAEMLVGKSMDEWIWRFEAVSRMRVTLTDIGEVRASSWSDLNSQASHASVIGKRQLYVLANDPSVKTYVLVSTIGKTGPLYLVPETLYRSRVDKSGANLRTP